MCRTIHYLAFRAWQGVARALRRGAARLREADGWRLKRTNGSHRHFTHPWKPGIVTVAGHPSATLRNKTEVCILRQAGLGKERP
ncbi:MAG TPA: type II toxin-antitoxin system HicA family toxin [Trebonia sp.]|nr:type II toxin-antitoxin system HicA family toxin [Trebonia sp.]